MHLIVLVKPVPDLANLSISRGQQAVFEKAKRLLNPADEAAVEAALTWKAALGGTLTVATAGDERDIDILRKPLAMGADRAIGVVAAGIVDPMAGAGAAAVVLAALVRKIAGNDGALVCCGIGSRAGAGSAQTGPRLAELLGVPCGVFVTGGTVDMASGSMEIRERLGAAERTRRLSLPAVCVIDPTGFKPRSANALALMKAAKKPIERMSPADLGLSEEVVTAAAGVLVVQGRELAEPAG